MDAELRARLASRFPGVFPVEGDLPRDGVVVPVEHHTALAALLKDAGYTLYVSVVATHFLAETPKGGEPLPERFEVATVLRRPVPGGGVCWWRVTLAPGQPIPTLVPWFAGADWQEREQYDLVGVVFEGHPDLRRLMLSEDWEGHPLRKDYAIDTPHPPWR